MARPRDPISGAATFDAAIVGAVPGAVVDEPLLVTSLFDFERVVGSADGETSDAVRLYFENGGKRAYVVGLDEAHPGRSLEALADTPFGLLLVPATARLREDRATSLAVAAALFAERTRSFYIVDPPAAPSTTTSFCRHTSMVKVTERRSCSRPWIRSSVLRWTRATG